MSGHLMLCWTCETGVNGHLQTSLERVKVCAAGTWLLRPLTPGICAMTLCLFVSHQHDLEELHSTTAGISKAAATTRAVNVTAGSAISPFST